MIALIILYLLFAIMNCVLFFICEIDGKRKLGYDTIEFKTEDFLILLLICFFPIFNIVYFFVLLIMEFPKTKIYENLNKTLFTINLKKEEKWENSFFGVMSMC